MNQPTLDEEIRGIIGTLVKWLEEYHELDTKLLKFEHPADREQFYKLAEKLLKARDAAIRIETVKVLKSRTSSHISLRSNRSEDCVLEATLDDYIASVERRESDQAKEEHNG